MALLQLGYWWYGMRKVVQLVVSRCKLCDMGNARGAPRAQQLHPLAVKCLFYRWGVDLAGPFSPTTPLVEGGDSFTFILVAIEHFSKHVELVPLCGKTAAEVAQVVLSHVIARFGAPAEILTDRGTEFEAEFDALLGRANSAGGESSVAEALRSRAECTHVGPCLAVDCVGL